jgi:hypothetical protein
MRKKRQKLLQYDYSPRLGTSDFIKYSQVVLTGRTVGEEKPDRCVTGSNPVLTTN